MTGKKRDDGVLSPENELQVLLSRALPNLYHWLVKRPTDVERFTVKRDDTGEWFAVLAAFGDDGSPIVVFGSGGSYIQALFGLNRAIAADRWRPDKLRS